MAYKNYVNFFMDFNKAWPKAGHGQGVRAFAYYTHGLTQGGATWLTIGLVKHLETALKKYGSVMGKDKDDQAYHNPDGRIFVDESNQSKWQIYHNDAFILGGIHSNGPFELVSPKAYEDWFWEKFGETGDLGFEDASQLDFVTSTDPDEKYPLRVTQREVMGLNEFGYVGSGDAIRVFECKQKAKANAATMFKYKAHVAGMRKALGFKEAEE